MTCDGTTGQLTPAYQITRFPQDALVGKAASFANLIHCDQMFYVELLGVRLFLNVNFVLVKATCNENKIKILTTTSPP